MFFDKDSGTIHEVASLIAVGSLKNDVSEGVTKEDITQYNSIYNEVLDIIINAVRVGDLRIIGMSNVANLMIRNVFLTKVAREKIINQTILLHEAFGCLKNKIELSDTVKIYMRMLEIDYVHNEILKYDLGNFFTIDCAEIDSEKKHLLEEQVEIIDKHIISEIHRLKGGRKGHKEREFKKYAEVEIFRELARGCTCRHETLANHINPVLMKKAQEMFTTSKVQDPGFQEKICRLIRDAASETFNTSDKYPDAKTRIKGSPKYVAPPPCKVHAKNRN